MADTDTRTPAAYGYFAEFTDAETLSVAASAAHEAGFRKLDAFTPYPVHGLAESIGFADRRVPIATLLGGLLGGALGFALQAYTNLDYPLNIGGRALVSPAAFGIVTMSLAMLCAVLAAIATMLLCNRLPRLHHPLFAIEGFERATTDRFFLVIFGEDERFDSAESFLAGSGAVRSAAIAKEGVDE